MEVAQRQHSGSVDEAYEISSSDTHIKIKVWNMDEDLIYIAL